MKTVLLLLLAAGFAAAKTERIDFPTGGVLHLKHSLGDVTVEGWDQSAMELTVTKPSEGRRSDEAAVTWERNGDEVVVTTNLQRHRGLAGFIYQIKVPRNARLVAESDGGEVHVADLAGDLRVTTKRGEITLRLPPDSEYLIDAQSRFGGVVSDFAGHERRSFWLVGHRFVPDATLAPHMLYLRTSFGDIIIHKIRRPIPAGP